MREGRRARGKASRTLACMWVAHLIIKLIKASIWQCHSCPAKRGGGGKKREFKCCSLWGPHVKGCFSSSTACVWLTQPLGKNRGGFGWGGGAFRKKKTFYKQMTRRHWILMFKNGSRKINTYQKEQHRNKKEIEQKQEIEKWGRWKGPLKLFKVALRLRKEGFIRARRPANIKESI